MLKKFLFFLIVLGLTIFAVNQFSAKQDKKSSAAKKQDNTSSEQTQQTKEIKIQKAAFVPYWSVTDQYYNAHDYNRFFYFGVAPNTSGINQDEAGYLGLSDFVRNFSDLKEKYLTLRMLDTDVNFATLKNTGLQDKIIHETIETAIKTEFTGVVLDFEIFSLFDTKVPEQINDFVARFYKELKNNNLKFALTIYGDVFFRPRPFDLEFLSKNSDEIIIMAYDYHKSGGEPGPNFPLPEFKKMIDEFTRVVPADKLTVAFGMFGYDWLVDEKKRPVRRAKSMSLAEIKKEFVTDCKWKNCLITRDEKQAEIEVNYIDPTGGLHIVWFEDEKSVEIKTRYLQEAGIDSLAYWAYGYW